MARGIGRWGQRRLHGRRIDERNLAFRRERDPGCVHPPVASIQPRGHYTGDRKVPDHTAAAATADKLLRMFTLTERAYTQVRHGLAYLFRDTPEQVRLLAPTVQQMRASASTPGVVASPTAKSEDAPSEERSAAE